MISRMRWMEKRSEHRRLRGFSDRSQRMFGKSAPESFLDVSLATRRLTSLPQRYAWSSPVRASASEAVEKAAGESEFEEEFSLARKFAEARDGRATGAERGMLHSKPVDAQKKDGRSPALKTGNLFRTLALRFHRRWNARHILFYWPGFHGRITCGWRSLSIKTSS